MYLDDVSVYLLDVVSVYLLDDVSMYLLDDVKMCAADLGSRVYKGAADDSTSSSLFAKAKTAHFSVVIK